MIISKYHHQIHLLNKTSEAAKAINKQSTNRLKNGQQLKLTTLQTLEQEGMIHGYKTESQVSSVYMDYGCGYHETQYRSYTISSFHVYNFLPT